MARALKKALEKMESLWFAGTPSRDAKLISGSADPGTRLAPARGTKHDKLIGARLDYGDKHRVGDKEFRRFKFQLNKDAEDSTVKKLANEDPHKIWAEADVQIKPAPSDVKKAREDLFAKMRESLEEKAGGGAKK